MWKVILTKQANKDAQKLNSVGLKPQTKALLMILRENPYQPLYEKLRGDLSGYYPRRINRQHRLIYQVFSEEKIVKVLRMWSHYE